MTKISRYTVRETFMRHTELHAYLQIYHDGDIGNDVMLKWRRNSSVDQTPMTAECVL